MIKNSIGIFLIIAVVFLGGIFGAQVVDNILESNIEHNPIIKQDTTVQDTTIFDKQQIIKTKQDTQYTGTTQGELTDEEMLDKEPDFIYYDTVEVIEEDGIRWYSIDTIAMQREADSIDAYMEYWYTYLDTNSDGDIDGAYIDSIDYDMGCGGKVHDSIIEWLEE